MNQELNFLQKKIDALHEKYDNLIKDIQNKRAEEKINIEKEYYSKLGYKKGDVIYNPTGIIKIEKITFRYNKRILSHVVYQGSTYKWLENGYVIKNKINEIGTIPSYANPKKITKNRIVNE